MFICGGSDEGGREQSSAQRAAKSLAAADDPICQSSLSDIFHPSFDDHSKTD
jgi:hypothetical protein